MGNRYWVGGSAAWDGTAGAKWSLTSGGASGQAVPTSSDDVFFDANSGVSTVTVTGSRTGHSLTCTGFTGTLTGASTPVLTIAGSNVVLVAGMTLSGAIAWVFSTGTCTLTTAGKTLQSLTVAVGGAGAVVVADALTVTGAITLTSGILSFTGTVAVSSASLSSSNTNSREIDSAGVWTLTGTGTVWDCGTSTNLTLSLSAGTIKLNDASASDKTFAGGSKTYGNVWLTGAGTGAFILTGSNTFADFKVDTAPHTVKFTDGTNTTVTSLTVNGSLGLLIIMESTAGSPWDITCASDVVALYVSLFGSQAHGNFTAGNSFDGGGNSTWVFVSSSSDVVYFDSAYEYIGTATATISGLNWLIGETLGVLADGVDIGDAVVSSAGNLTLPDSETGVIVIVGKRYLSRAVTLRAPQTGNADGASLGRQMNIKKVAADILDTGYLEAGSLSGTEQLPPRHRRTNDGDLYTGLFEIPIDDSHQNEGVVVFETDKAYPATVRAIRFEIESEP